MVDVVVADNVATRLELVQALRLSTTPASRKLELVMSFIDSGKVQEGCDPDAWIQMSQVIGFLSEWVQTALIKASKSGAEDQSGVVPAHLDARYWSVLKFCLSSGYVHHMTGVSPSLMRPLSSCISSPSLFSESLTKELIEVVPVLFSEYGRPFRSNLDSWVSLTCHALSLLRPERSVTSDPSVVVLVSAIVEGFSRTVASHPNPGKVFQSVVSRLLEPLLVLIGESISNPHNNKYSLLRVVKAAEEIIENGIFHPSHVGGFFEVCVFLKGGSVGTNVKSNSEARQRSYHRTFFQKLDELRKAGNFLVLIGLGRIFKIYAKRWNAQQVALSEDVYGVRGQGKSQVTESIPGDKAERSGEAKSGDKSGQEVEAEKGEESAAASQPRRHANQTDALFTVFAELLGPLNLELSSLIGLENSEAGNIKQTEEQVSLLMLGANELLAAAKESEAYKSIEDTISLTYFNFLQEVYNLTIKAGAGAFDVWSNGRDHVAKKRKRSLGGAETRISSKKKSEAVFSEVVFALQHLLELEYRVFEQQLSSVWVFLFKMVAPAIEVNRTTLKALEFSCGLNKMYSDLRQVEIPIFHITDTLTDLQGSSQPDFLSDAVEKIVCTKQYLVSLGSVIHKLPEGQVAHLLKGLKAAVAKTLDSFDSQQAMTSKFRGSMKGLLEIYMCILENANVTSSNSALAGVAVRELLMKVLAPLVAELVDAVTQDEFCVTTKSLFLLSIYISSRILHRQCLSLMPPKAARKARTAVFDVEIDPLSADQTEVITYLKASGFLMSLQRGSVKMSKILTKLFQRSLIEGGMHSSAMIHTVNSIAIQSLVDLDRRVWTLKFLISKAESKKKYMKVLRSLEKEGAKLVSIVLKNLIPIENEETFLSSIKWNRVWTTVDSNTISIARWWLICETVDVWSAFANEEHLKNFVMVLLRTGKACALQGVKECYYSGEKAGSMAVEEYSEVNLDIITEGILKNLDFYEIEGLRKVFSSAFLEELKKTLLSSFEEACPIFRIIDDCIQGITPPSAAESNAVFIEKVKLNMESINKLSSSTRKELVLNEEQKRTFSDCTSLLNLLASLPCGYLPPADNARCAHTICQLEIFLVDFLLGDNAVQLREPFLGKSTYLISDDSRLVWADATIACRHALDFLANSSATSEPGNISSEFTRALFGSSTSTQCVTLLPEIVAMRTLPAFIPGRDDEHSQGILSVPPDLNTSSVFYTLLNETCAVIEASLANICSAEAKALVTPKASSDATTVVERKSAKRKSKKLKGALSALGIILVTEALNVEKFLETEEYPRWHRHVSTLAAVSSTLWSMTSALERVDKECRNSPAASLVWRTELPDAWVYIVQELEPILVRILLQVLFPMGVTGLEFFSKTDTKVLEVNDTVVQDSIAEDILDGDESKSFRDEDLPEEALDTSSDEESEVEEDDTEVQDVLETYDHNAEVTNTDQSFQALKDSVIGESSSSQFASLHSVLEGNVREKSEFVGELYMAVAAIVKLRSLFSSPFSFTTVGLESTDVVSFKDQSRESLDTLLLAAYRLLLGSVHLIQTQKLMNPGWLVGVIKYIGSVGSYLPCMEPFILPVDFAKLIDLHLELIGAVLVLKENSLTNVDGDLGVTTLGTIESPDWDLDAHDVGVPETRRMKSAGTTDQIDDLLFITQRSFESLLKYAPRQHTVLALQSVEKAVAGVWGGSDQGLGFESEKLHGFEVGPVVAAGVDCLGLALQAVSGKMRLHLLASHCPSFYGGLYNLIAHCQGPSIFLERRQLSGPERLSSKVNAAPVVLRGLEILTTLAARAVIFPMKASSVAMALQCPGMLFRSFYDVGKAKALLQNASCKHGLQNLEVTARVSPLQGFNEMSVKLYVACCRLICALLRHRIRECGRSMALLGESCRILLHCLTAPSLVDSADASFPSTAAWAAQCGSWLSRVYQEMESHKETMGKYCSHLLADYLNVISGQSLEGVGLKIEVDSALRRGAFALLDACSGNDLQQLHAALGEGARRSALMTLRHDYDLHYKYTGKV